LSAACESEDYDPVAEISRLLSNEQLPCLLDKCRAFVEAVIHSSVDESSSLQDLFPVFSALDNPLVLEACGLVQDASLEEAIKTLNSLDDASRPKEEIRLIQSNRALFDQIILQTPYLE